MAVNLMIENDTFVTQLRLAIRSSEGGLSHVPALLKDILQNERWKDRTIKTGEPAEFNDFEKFVKAKPLAGLGASIDLLKRLCSNDLDTLELIDKVTQRPDGPPPRNQNASAKPKTTVDNVNSYSDRPDGNSRQRAIRHLREKRPDLLARVLADELSPHAAMVEAGFRQRTITIPDDPEAAARRLVRHFRAERLDALIAALASHCGRHTEAAAPAAGNP